MIHLLNNIFFAAVLVLIFLWGLPSVITAFLGAPWSPTPKKTIEAMFKLAKLKKGDKFYDLGSGYGRVLVSAAKKYHTESIGVEIDPIKVFISRICIKLFGLNSIISVKQGNLFKFDYSNADVIFVYLLLPTNKRLEGEFKKNLKKGTKIITHAFTFPGWRMTGKNEKYDIYLYEVGKSF